MIRLSRIKWIDDATTSDCSIFGCFDAIVKENLRINDAEYDYLCEIGTDDEINLLSQVQLNYADKRKLSMFLDKRITEFNNKKNDEIL